MSLSSAPPTAPAMGRTEFVALMAMMGGVVAFSIDAMLPALPGIGAELSPQAVNRAQLVVTSFVLGMGLGTFLVGPISDRFGRKPVILAGTAIYALAALLALVTPSLELLVLARILQGLGASAARIVSLAIIRDLYAGRAMARMMSFVMMVFTLVPAVAPLLGSGIIALAGWRGIFASFVLFAALYSLWMALRLPEPLPPGRRQPFRPTALWHAAREVLSYRSVRLSIAVQTLCFAMLFGSLSSIQQVMGDTYGRAAQFPYWFSLIAVIGGAASLTNAALVMRLGMRRLVSFALSAQIALCFMALALLHGSLPAGAAFGVYMIWQTLVFVMISLTPGNLTALAMEPLGHIAGMAASVISGLATVGSVALAVPIGLAFDGTPLPLIIGVLACAGLGRALMRSLNRAEATA